MSAPDVDVLARLDDGRVVAVRQRNVIATAFHPELAGEPRFHRLLATMAGRHTPIRQEGCRTTTASDAPGRGGARERIDEQRPRPGRVRAARLTDLAAVGELSRLAHPAQAPAPPKPPPSHGRVA